MPATSTDSAAIELALEILKTRDKLADLIDESARRLEEGENPYRMASILRAVTRITRLHGTEQRDRIEAVRSLLDENRTGAASGSLRPSEQGDPRGDADNGR